MCSWIFNTQTSPLIGFWGLMILLYFYLEGKHWNKSLWMAAKDSPHMVIVRIRKKFIWGDVFILFHNFSKQVKASPGKISSVYHSWQLPRLEEYDKTSGDMAQGTQSCPWISSQSINRVIRSSVWMVGAHCHELPSWGLGHRIGLAPDDLHSRCPAKSQPATRLGQKWGLLKEGEKGKRKKTSTKGNVSGPLDPQPRIHYIHYMPR